MNFLPAEDIVANRRQGTESHRLANDLGKAVPKLSFHDYLPMALQYSFKYNIVPVSFSFIDTCKCYKD